MKSTILPVALASFYLVSCSTPVSPGTERGPDNTIAYTISIDSSQPGAKVEVNHQFVGVTPLTVKVFGDFDGTFHNFGSDEYTVRADPPSADYYPQTKIFKTGAFGVKDDKVPAKIFFDFGAPIAKSK